MANIVEIILKGVDQTSGAFKESEKSAKSLEKALKGIAGTGAGIAAIGLTMKKAFDLGREGAAIEQTSESFDFLMQKVDAAPDLLEQLTAASHGTISTFELQSSTMTLLAGASGELGTSLANATPRLMEIAKAANKLNPALGTTAFMYESIATGVKRAQPLILDNLGLTLKVGEANEAYARSMGKTVEEMTAQDKAMAILNATLEAGDTLIAQVGGTTDAATDSFDQLDVNMQEIVDTIKKGLYPQLNKAAEAILLIKNRGKLLDDVLADHIETLLKTTGSWEEFREQVLLAEDEMSTELIPGAEGAANILEFFGLITRETTSALDDYTESLYLTESAIARSDEISRKYVDTYSALIPVVDKAGDEVDEFAEILLENETAAEKAQKANKKFLDGLDPAIDSPIDAFIKDIQWFLATGGQFEAAFARVKELAKTAPEEALTIAEDLFGMVIDTQEEMGLITADEAAANLKDTLGMELWETRRLITGSGSVEEAMAGLGDVYIDLGELERMEAMTLRILQNLTLMRTRGIEIGVPSPSPGSPYEFPTPPQEEGPGPQEDVGTRTGTTTPTGTGTGPQQTFIFNPSSELDAEEMLQRVAQIVAEN